jgi:hypothetical protein
VPGVHAFGTPMIGITRGSVIVAWKLRERPAAAELKPLLADVVHAPLLELLHRPVAGFLEFRRPVRRGPYRSVSQNIVSITCDRSALLADPRQRSGVHALGCLRRSRRRLPGRRRPEGGHEDRRQRTFIHHCPPGRVDNSRRPGRVRFKVSDARAD